jgi:arsenite methyltransferase
MPRQLRDEVRAKYREVAETPTVRSTSTPGRDARAALPLRHGPVDELPDDAVESFAGVANPFELRDLEPGERVVDVGSGAGFDSFLAARRWGPAGASSAST